MTPQKFTQIANSNNPFDITSFGLTRLFTEFRGGFTQYWIEYQNEYGCSTMERVTMGKYNAYCA